MSFQLRLSSKVYFFTYTTPALSSFIQIKHLLLELGSFSVYTLLLYSLSNILFGVVLYLTNFTLQRHCYWKKMKMKEDEKIHPNTFISIFVFFFWPGNMEKVKVYSDKTHDFSFHIVAFVDGYSLETWDCNTLVKRKSTVIFAEWGNDLGALQTWRSVF